ncbi:DUF5667 domain-containing protein [Streptomyces litchfieldiae]|uniref:DUF5667 domain-containing protein n=1 Tax=Streptomyces litchfieldiae TaxID=3075543 RepID=A0ABU2MPK4_9ACTN|nr:DUF5667 domain-containing protein [Streptomyces sp. DSM 44938]MDT0343440.1 DUF5667 domain-containing protein [Streptomyces sp. DSM 44938]
MIGSVSANRRANAFAHLLNESRLDQPRLGDGETAGEPPVDGGEQAALLSVVDRLTALPRPELEAETRTAQRARLVAAMEAAFDAPGDPAKAARRGDRVPGQRRAPGIGGAHRAPPGFRRGRLWPRTRLSKGLAAGGLTMGVAAAGFGGVAAASSDALPGDTLYGLKRGMEDLHLDFTSGDADRGRVYLDHASTRLNEARRLLERGRSGELDHEELDAIRRALTSMRDDAAEGHRLLSQAYQSNGSIDPIRSLSAFSDGHRDTWAQVRDRLPVQLHDVSTDVTDVFQAMDEDIAPLASLLPEEPANVSSAGASDRAPDQPPTHPEHSRPATTPDSRSTGDRDDARSETASPAESAEESHGLLEGAGLLEPSTPENGTGAESRDTTRSGEPDRTLPDADITVPPLVEDLLPSLGLDVEKER